MKITLTYNLFVYSIAVVFLLLFSNCSEQNSEISYENKSEDLSLLEYCDLRNNPDKYDGKIVRLRAEINSGNHGDHLYDKRCPGNESVHSYPDGLTAIFYKNKAEQDKVREIRDRRIDSNSQKVWTDSVNVTAVRLFKKNKPLENESSYERNAPFHFTVITIESFSETD